MKKTLAILMALLALAFVVSCSQDVKGGSSEGLVGTWTSTPETKVIPLGGSYLKTESSTEYTFNADSTFVFEIKTVVVGVYSEQECINKDDAATATMKAAMEKTLTAASGTYTIVDDTILLESAQLGPTEPGHYTIEGNTLTLTSNGESFVMTRK